MNKVLKINERYRKRKVQYDKAFPETYDMGNMTKVEERFVNAVLSELYNQPYNPDGFIIPYERLALNVGGQFVKKIVKDDAVYTYARIGKRLNKAIENLKDKLVTVSYKKIISTDEHGMVTEYDDIFLFTDRVKVNHDKQEYKVFLSDSILEDSYIDYDEKTGEVIEHPAKRVYDLFYQEDWSKIQYLKYSLTIHNALSSQYTMRLYRELAGYRNYKEKRYYAYAEHFETGVMKIDTPSLMQNKSVIIREAFNELKALKDQHGDPIIPGLDMRIERRGRKTYKYEFVFKNFSNDLLPVIAVLGNGVFELQFPSNSHSSKDEGELNADFDEVIEVFKSVFGTDNSVDNRQNRKTLRDFLSVMDKEVIIEVINRTGYKSNRSFGWTINTLRNLQQDNVKTIDDLKLNDTKKFRPDLARITELIESNKDYNSMFAALTQQLQGKIPLIVIDDLLKHYINKGMEIKLVEEAIKESIYQRQTNWKYTKGILDNWRDSGIYAKRHLENKEEFISERIQVSDDFLEAMRLWENELE